MLEKLRAETLKDKDMQVLTEIITVGWPDSKSELPPSARPFFDLRATMSIVNGLIMRGGKVLVPRSMRDEIKRRLHAAHLAANSMLRRARRTVFWPGIGAEIKQMADVCEACQQSKPRNQKETLIQHEIGQQPWEKVGSDIFEIKGSQYLILVDYFSSFIEVDYLPTLTSENVVLKMKSPFARYGLPKVLVSDCGPQYISATFSRFTKHWGIRHVRSSPGHHLANGKAEAAVKVVKDMMTRCLIDHEDQYEALLELRNTPRQNGESPAQVMFQRETRTLLPSVAKKNPVFNNDWKRKVEHNLKS